MREHSLLLDTHVVIWMASQPERLPDFLLAAIENAGTRYVSHASAWEIQIKHEKHGEKFDFSLSQLEGVMKVFSCTELPIEYEDIRRLDRLHSLHRDPFDRLLIAQASRRSVYLATLDQKIISAFEESGQFSIFTDRARKSAQTED